MPILTYGGLTYTKLHADVEVRSKKAEVSMKGLVAEVQYRRLGVGEWGYFDYDGGGFTDEVGNEDYTSLGITKEVSSSVASSDTVNVDSDGGSYFSSPVVAGDSFGFSVTKQLSSTFSVEDSIAASKSVGHQSVWFSAAHTEEVHASVVGKGLYSQFLVADYLEYATQGPFSDEVSVTSHADVTLQKGEDAEEISAGDIVEFELVFGAVGGLNAREMNSHELNGH
jgi:hypothetical protein